MADQIQNNEVTQIIKGLHLDNSYSDQPKGTYRFALNSVVETELGDSGFIGNEESNIPVIKLTPGFTPIGKTYLGFNKLLIFSVLDTTSEIGLFNTDTNKYEVIINDKSSTGKAKLNFNIKYPIDSTYRLRRGCEDTVYFTDGLNSPRYMNLGKLNQLKTGLDWDAEKFKLFKKIKQFPTINKVEVVDNLGSLVPGSYSILVQHLDEDLNGTEFYELVDNIIIYNDSVNNVYSDIQGSMHLKTEEDGSAYTYEDTNKAIKISLDLVDKSFAYVRFAFAERISGTGDISSVKYSEPVSVFNPQYIYTGKNAQTSGTREELELFNIGSGISTAKHIEQIDNMLILSNTTGEEVKSCELQKYASKIAVDCFVQDTILTSIKDNHNSKNPLSTYYGLGYQPGEIYSLGIIYVYEDFSLSPVMHIPGKSSKVKDTHIFSEGARVYPMKNINNTNTSETYIDENTSCSSGDYWGRDSQGDRLKNQPVRHHRFPTRKDLGLNFVSKINTTGGVTRYNKIQLAILGQVKVSDKEATPPYVAPVFNIIVRYKRKGVSEFFQTTIYPDSGIKPSNIESNIFLQGDLITEMKVFYQEIDKEEVEIKITEGTSGEQSNGLTYNLSITPFTENTTVDSYKANILGLKLSNIELPPESEIGKKVIGYQIVRNERTEEDKTILDSAVAFPMLKSGRNVSTAMLAPEFWKNTSMAQATCENSEDGTFPTCFNVSKRNLILLTPGHKFANKTYDGFTSIEQVGVFSKTSTARSATSTQNIFEGTSASGEEDKATKDDDGFTLRHGYRYSKVDYTDTPSSTFKIENKNTRMYDLNALNSAETADSKETLYNISGDNRALVLSSTEDNIDIKTYGPGKDEFPYLHIKKYSETFYQNFRNKPYYLVSTKVFNSHTIEVFGGDSFISPMRYSNHIFGSVGVAMRRKKMSAWEIIVAVVLVAIASVLAVFLGPTSLIAIGGILAALGGIATAGAAIIESEKFTEIYANKWEANLDKTVFDYFYAALFIREYPHEEIGEKDHFISKYYLTWQDDTFRWFGDIVGDLWFESQLNISLRVPPRGMTENYLKPLKPPMSDGFDKWRRLTWQNNVEWVKTQAFQGNGFHRFKDDTVEASLNEEWFFLKKITTTSGSNGNMKYQGISTPIIYLINPDYNYHIGIKKHYAIPITYDCCSECGEKFPHRLYYSQQSFQEEKSDNYRMFLPNNYRDIEGETGEITNIFRFYNNLFVHTKEALWKMGRNYQERVTDEVVSFIGTGSYFEIPPQKIIDDSTGMSAGSQHKWSGLKTPNGYFFVSANQTTIFQFSGEKLNPISNIGLNSWFNTNLLPNNPETCNFISTYDSRKERVLFTKKDFNVAIDSSWTLSFSLKNNTWISWHSYLPDFYMNTPGKFFSWIKGNDNIWEHNTLGSYQVFYNTKYPHIIEYVSLSNPLTTRDFNTISFQTTVKDYHKDLKEYSEDYFTTFNKAILYNSRQCSGELELISKDKMLQNEDYLTSQIINNNTNTSIIDRTEKDWFLNDFRDYRIDYTKPIWNSDPLKLQDKYYIDKVLNISTIDYNKDWTQLENFKDKYLVVRLIFDNFASKKIITNYSIENEQLSLH